MTIAATHSSGTMGPIELAIIAAIWLVSMFFSAKIGRKKGYNPWLFGFLGFFFGLIMVVIVFVMPYRRDKVRGGAQPSV